MKMSICEWKYWTFRCQGRPSFNGVFVAPLHQPLSFHPLAPPSSFEYPVVSFPLCYYRQAVWRKCYYDPFWRFIRFEEWIWIWLDFPSFLFYFSAAVEHFVYFFLLLFLPPPSSSCSSSSSAMQQWTRRLVMYFMGPFRRRYRRYRRPLTCSKLKFPIWFTKLLLSIHVAISPQSTPIPSVCRRPIGNTKRIPPRISIKIPNLFQTMPGK